MTLSRLCGPLGSVCELHELVLHQEEQIQPYIFVYQYPQERRVRHSLRRRLDCRWSGIQRHRYCGWGQSYESDFLASQHNIPVFRFPDY